MFVGRSLLALLTVPVLIALGGAPMASAQSGAYPAKPIRWVVPFPPGSPVDANARMIGSAMSTRLGQSVVVDNRPGAYGTIGAGEVARAAPDGYTMLFTIQDPLIAATATVKSLPYDPSRDFKFLSMATVNGPVVVVNSKYPAKNVRELVELARKSDPPLAYGSWGPGSLAAVIIETMAKQAGVTFRDIPYRGSPPAMQDMLGGRIALTLTSPNVAAPLVAAGKVNAIAVVGSKRSPALPNTETFVEAGYDNFVMRNRVWTGLLAPSGLPAELADLTVRAFQAALREPAVSKFLVENGYEVVGNSPAEFEAAFREEYAVIPKVIREDLGVLPQ